jgi:C4-type Zn-finger protein
MKQVLKCCPFCGREPKVTQRPSTISEDKSYFVSVSCMCGGYSACAYKSASAETGEEALVAAAILWNSRVD